MLQTPERKRKNKIKKRMQTIKNQANNQLRISSAHARVLEGVNNGGVRLYCLHVCIRTCQYSFVCLVSACVATACGYSCMLSVWVWVLYVRATITHLPAYLSGNTQHSHNHDPKGANNCVNEPWSFQSITTCTRTSLHLLLWLTPS